MSGNTVKAGAAYEAVLVDNVTKKVDTIIQSLDRLQEAFRDTGRVAQQAGSQINALRTRGGGPGGIGGRGGRGDAGGVMSIGGGIGAISTGIDTAVAGIGKGMMKAASVVNTAAQSMGQAFIHIGHMARNAGLIAVGMAAGMTAALYSTIKVAGDAEETMSAFNAVFREGAEVADEWAKTFSKQVSRSVNDVRNGMRTFQSFFVGMGFGADKAADLSKQMQSLSIDFASFFNITDEEGLRRFIGGLSGSSENLLRFGINVQEAALDQTKFAAALGKTAKEMTQMEKASARMEIIVKTMKDLNAEGDAFRTRFSFQNQLKALSAAFRSLQQSIGKDLMNNAKDLVRTLTSLMEQAQAFSGSFKNLAIGTLLLGAFGSAATAAGIAISTLGVAGLALTSVLATALGTVGALLAGGFVPMAAAALGAVAAFKTAQLAVMTFVGALNSIDLSVIVDAFTKAFTNIREIVLDAMKDIGIAIRFGNFELVWRQFVRAGKAAIEEIVDFFNTVMQELRLRFEIEAKVRYNKFLEGIDPTAPKVTMTYEGIEGVLPIDAYNIEKAKRERRREQAIRDEAAQKAADDAAVAGYKFAEGAEAATGALGDWVRGLAGNTLGALGAEAPEAGSITDAIKSLEPDQSAADAIRAALGVSLPKKLSAKMEEFAAGMQLKAAGVNARNQFEAAVAIDAMRDREAELVQELEDLSNRLPFPDIAAEVDKASKELEKLRKNIEAIKAIDFGFEGKSEPEPAKVEVDAEELVGVGVGIGEDIGNAIFGAAERSADLLESALGGFQLPPAEINALGQGIIDAATIAADLVARAFLGEPEKEPAFLPLGQTGQDPRGFMGPVFPDKVQKMVKALTSVGSFVGGFAGQASAFAPVMDPIEQEIIKLTEVQKQTRDASVKIANWTDIFGRFQ